MNLTITIEDDILKLARHRALEENTSVNAVIREYLTAYAGVDRGRRAAIARLLELSDASVASSEGRMWTRDDLHER